jgi:hypothetical protein
MTKAEKGEAVKKEKIAANFAEKEIRWAQNTLKDSDQEKYIDATYIIYQKRMETLKNEYEPKGYTIVALDLVQMFIKIAYKRNHERKALPVLKHKALVTESISV